MTQFSIVINAGGKSTRMGTDKAFLEIDGKPMIERIIEQTAGLGEQLIVANEADKYAHLRLPVVGDLLPDKGALGGLYTAIQAASHPYTFVLACDMPFVNRPLLEHLMSLAPNFEAVVPRLMADGKAEAEPFRAIYSKACLGPIKTALDAGKMRVISFFPDMNLRWVEEDELRQYDPELLTFMNCNTPEELEAVRQKWQMTSRK
jgi:molybdenum cofactor guanylyltransferase